MLILPQNGHKLVKDFVPHVDWQSRHRTFNHFKPWLMEIKWWTKFLVQTRWKYRYWSVHEKSFSSPKDTAGSGRNYKQILRISTEISRQWNWWGHSASQPANDQDLPRLRILETFQSSWCSSDVEFLCGTSGLSSDTPASTPDGDTIDQRDYVFDISYSQKSMLARGKRKEYLHFYLDFPVFCVISTFARTVPTVSPMRKRLKMRKKSQPRLKSSSPL